MDEAERRTAGEAAGPTEDPFADALPADPSAADAPPAGGRDLAPHRAGRLRTTPLRGLAMGLADSVPGVSGGTVALILGIHPRLVRAIAAIDISIAAALLRGRQTAARAWHHADLGFLALLGLGIVLGIGAGAKLLSIVLERWPVALMAVLLGLVVVSIRHPARVPAWDLRDVGIACATAIGAFTIGVLPGAAAPTHLWFLPLAGAVAACAMILPGISGAYLLVLMGLYEPVIHALAHLDLRVVVLMGVGAVVGLLAFSRALRHLLDRHPGPTHAAMVGLLVGSLVRLWPWRDAHGFAEGHPSLPLAVAPWAFLALGALAGWALDRVGRWSTTGGAAAQVS